MREWAEGNAFNSFNSWKGLLYADWYRGVAEGTYLPPIEASVDLIHACNLHCRHCNAHRYLDGAMRISDDHLLALISELGDWGVRAVCFGGGGEPTLHSGLGAAIIMSRAAGMSAAVTTNGVQLTDALDSAALLCRWVGISVDAATAATYARLKGASPRVFDTVTDNLERLAKRAGPHCDIAFKFLVSSINQTEVLAACQLARNLGARDFHARPMDFHHQGMGAELDGQLAGVDVDRVRDQMAACHELATDDFHVYTVVHKFGPDWSPVKRFRGCWAAPLAIQLCADGWGYLCVDQRHNPALRLGRHDPDLGEMRKWWGSAAHQALVRKSAASCTTRCTFGVYAEQCERLFINDDDPMCWEFT